MSFLWKKLIKLHSHVKYLKIPHRSLNLLEYQSKNLLKHHGIAVQDFCIIDENGSKELEKFYANEYVVKAQILAGGRGKGHFDNGFKGGVHITKERSEITDLVDKMLGFKLITKQTPKQGIPVRKIMIAESVNIVRETYLCIAMDRNSNGPVIIASPAGGVDIEAVAEKTPDLIKHVPIDVYEGISDKIANEIADFLQFKKEMKGQAADQIKKLYKMFVDLDCIQLEINPLVETDENKIVSVDAKLNFDDNAQYRQKQLFELEDFAESDPREVEASKFKLNYIGLTGNIGCLVNGAGLAMATMDIIKLHGGVPANFLDVGGSVTESQVNAAFKILTEDKNVRCVLVNIFGGIVNCATIANGLVAAMKSTKFNLPLIVRLEGTNASVARKIIKTSGLTILNAEDLDDAAQQAVSSLK